MLLAAVEEVVAEGAAEQLAELVVLLGGVHAQLHVGAVLLRHGLAGEQREGEQFLVAVLQLRREQLQELGVEHAVEGVVEAERAVGHGRGEVGQHLEEGGEAQVLVRVEPAEGGEQLPAVGQFLARGLEALLVLRRRDLVFARLPEQHVASAEVRFGFDEFVVELGVGDDCVDFLAQD